MSAASRYVDRSRVIQRHSRTVTINEVFDGHQRREFVSIDGVHVGCVWSNRWVDCVYVMFDAPNGSHKMHKLQICAELTKAAAFGMGRRWLIRKGCFSRWAVPAVAQAEGV